MKVLHFTTTVRDGDARAPGALVKLLKRKGLPITAATGQQIHKDKIAIVPKLKAPKKYEGYDGFLTDQLDQPLTIFTADCVAIFLADRKERMVGVLHAGWRGVKAGILRKAARIARHRWGVKPQDLTVWLSPSIGPCCFEVQWDVARYFPKTRQRRNDRWTVNLEKEISHQAKQAGFQLRTDPSRCTMHNKQFHSYRRNKTDQRMASVIVKKS